MSNINLSKYGYIFEVIEFTNNYNGEGGWKNEGKIFKHVGYMNIIFESKKEACNYYNKHNKHMSKLYPKNTYNTLEKLESDCNPNDNLIYVIRTNYYGLKKEISPFGE